MRYKDIILSNQDAGEETMLKTVSRVDELLEDIKYTDPNKYWRFMRKTHSDLCGCHYDADFADYDVGNLRYTDRDGAERTGGHWSKEETTAVTRSMPFPEETTTEDIYVALNVIYADLCRVLTDDQVITVAYTFFFYDEDAPSGKIWRYMEAMTKKC